MRPSWAVATLAIDPFRQPIRKSRVFLQRVRLSLNITVVTGHAPVADLPADVASGVIAGADPIINPGFEDVGHGPVETDLTPLYVRPAVARVGGEEFF